MNFSKRPGDKIRKVGKLVNNGEPVITIVTPFYNGGNTLEETANSIFSQTYPYFEWVIVDDGSTDLSSLKKLNEIEKIDSRVKIFHKENGGPSQARDFGIMNASSSSKYIYFLDCDDIIDNTMIEVMYWSLETHPQASFVYPSIINFGDLEYYWEPYFSLEEEIVNNVMCINTMVKKNALLDVGCFGIKEKAMFEDWNLWLKLLAKGYIPIRINAPLFWYRVNTTGEFARANKNYGNAMKLINSTVKTIKGDVKAIQFPNVDMSFESINDTSNMFLPKYKLGKSILFLLPSSMVNQSGIFNYEIIKNMSSRGYKCFVVSTEPVRNSLRQEIGEYADYYDLTNFIDYGDYHLFIDYLINSRNISSVYVNGSLINYALLMLIKKMHPDINIIEYSDDSFISKDVNNIVDFSFNNDFSFLSDTKLNSSVLGNNISIKEKYDIPKNKKIISFIERISYDENPLLFIDIAKCLLKKYDDLFFLISGNGPMYNNVQKKIEEDNLSDSILLMNQVDGDDLYLISDIVVSCPRKEGVSSSFYKALINNVPVVVNNVLGQGDIISDNGIVVHNFDDSASFVNAIIDILDNINNYKEKVSSNMNKWNNIINYYCDKFEKVFKIKDRIVLDSSLLQLSYDSLTNNLKTYISDMTEKYYSDYLGLTFNNHSLKVDKVIRLARTFGIKYNAQNELQYIFHYLRICMECLKRFLAFGKRILIIIVKFIPFIYNIIKICFKFLNKKRVILKRKLMN